MNKRQHMRHSMEHPAIMILNDGIKIDCRIRDLSYGGLFIRPDNKRWAENTDNAALQNTIVAIQVVTQRGRKGSSIIVQAAIAHISSAGLGIAFLNQENELLDYLLRLTPSSNKQPYKDGYTGNRSPKMVPKEMLIAEWLHSCTRRYLDARYPEFIRTTCNILFDAANAAGDNQTRSALFDAYNLLKNSEDEVKQSFLETINSNFNRFKSGNRPTDDLEQPPSDQSNMELVAKEDFEEWVSVVSLTRNLDQGLSSKLHELENALSFLNKTYINNESNPVSPYSLLWSFKRSISDLGIAPSVKKLLFSAFRDNMLKDIGGLYDEIGQYLGNHGITHQAYEEIARRPQHPSPVDTRKKLTDTLSSLVNIRGNIGGSENLQSKGVAPREMVVRSLEDISPLSRRPIIQKIEEQLAGEQVNGHPAVVDSHVRDAIKVSENLLGSLQQDFVIGPEIHNLIDSLKIPFIRETINDPNLLNDANHPGHKLLETIGKLTPFLPTDLENRSDKGYLFQALEEITKLAEQGAELDIKEITGHLEHLIDYQKDNFQNNLDMVTQCCEQDEQYLTAQNTVFELLCSKLSNRTVPKVVEELLHLGWIGLLVQTILTLGEDDDNTGKLSGVIDLLLDILDSEQGIQRVDKTQSEYLITVITEGLRKYPIHVEESHQFITMLEEFLNSGGSKYAEFATEQVELNEDLIRQLLDEQSSASHITTTETKVEQPWLNLVANIKQDDWIVEQRRQGHVRMLNLAWKNRASTRYAFVDGEGKKSLDIENHHLALLFKQQQCSLLENGNLPIVERAVHRLLKNTFEQIKNDSESDELTGLLGRKGFQREIAEIINITNDIGDQHIMLELDIDQFSMINDLCGFKGGDKLLQTVANIISNYLPPNTILARIGDDEFGILIKNCSSDEGYHVAETQRRALENLRYTWDGTDIPVRASVGIVLINPETSSTTEVLNKASSACQLAIQDGGNCTRIYQPTDNDIKKRKQLAQAVPIIEDALKNNKLALFAQPITPLFLDEEEEHHYEILLRVKSDDGNWGSPEEFIQAAEQYNRMRSVDRWVINHIFSWLENHYQEIGGTGFSINLSAHSMDDETFPVFINGHLDRSPFPNDQITLEITETSLVQHIDKAKLLVEDIKSKGVKFSLDDFGTGYSSYSYLKDIPVDYVKIDGVFIKDILTDSSSHAMVKSITEISHHMGKKVVAEYVENEAILVALRELEVDFAQGFCVGHPVPLNNLLQERL